MNFAYVKMNLLSTLKNVSLLLYSYSLSPFLTLHDLHLLFYLNIIFYHKMPFLVFTAINEAYTRSLYYYYHCYCYYYYNSKREWGAAYKQQHFANVYQNLFRVCLQTRSLTVAKVPLLNAAFVSFDLTQLELNVCSLCVLCVAKKTEMRGKFHLKVCWLHTSIVENLINTRNH